MWTVLEPRIESCRRELAAEFGCDPEEMAITRNASESLETLISGIDLKPGDEVIYTTQNYPRMITSWEQRARREGIVAQADLLPGSAPVAAPTSSSASAQAITPRTRVIEVTHITNLTGQILPVRDIVRLGREHGIEVFVDGAHAFAQFPFKRDDLECDYYATSLHKWLFAPIGTGFLYVRKAKQKSIWPLMAAPAKMDEDIRKYEEIGTHPAANHNAIAVALAFHRGIGAERKAARLRLLRDRWAKRLAAADPRFKILTPLNDTDSCGIGFIHVEGLDTEKLQAHLWDKHRIMTTPIVHPEFNGLRITPNVYTTLDEVDAFCGPHGAAPQDGPAGLEANGDGLPDGEPAGCSGVPIPRRDAMTRRTPFRDIRSPASSGAAAGLHAAGAGGDARPSRSRSSWTGRRPRNTRRGAASTSRRSRAGSSRSASSNPTRERVAVALSVDGRNVVDAARTSALAATKWILGPYQTAEIPGWQVSGQTSRKFFFTETSRSYAKWLGDTANVGTIEAVFFREKPRRRRSPA